MGEISTDGRLTEVTETVPDDVIVCASWRHAGSITDLDRAVVTGEHRRRDITGKLPGHGIVRAVKQGAGNVLLKVVSSNTAVIRFYAINWFIPANRCRNCYGRGADAMIMGKRMNVEKIR